MRMREVEFEEVTASARAFEHSPFPWITELIDPTGIQLGRKIAARGRHNNFGDTRLGVATKTSAPVDAGSAQAGDEFVDAHASPRATFCCVDNVLSSSSSRGRVAHMRSR
jgi:hypothetical protein